MAQSLIGASLKRCEDAALLRGAGQYVDDLREPGTLHLAFVRSPYAHARIQHIDTAAALALPVVVAALALADLDGATHEPTTGPSGAQLRRPTPLATDVVRFVGEPVVAVIAESAALVEDAVALVDVAYDALPAPAGSRRRCCPTRRASTTTCRTTSASGCASWKVT